MRSCSFRYWSLLRIFDGLHDTWGWSLDGSRNDSSLSLVSLNQYFVKYGIASCISLYSCVLALVLHKVPSLNLILARLIEFRLDWLPHWVELVIEALFDSFHMWGPGRLKRCVYQYADQGVNIFRVAEKIQRSDIHFVAGLIKSLSGLELDNRCRPSALRWQLAGLLDQVLMCHLS